MKVHKTGKIKVAHREFAAPFMKSFSPRAHVSAHFVNRLYTRFDLIQRTYILVKLNHVISDEALKAGMKIGSRVRVPITTDWTAIVSKTKENTLDLITVFVNFEDEFAEQLKVARLQEKARLKEMKKAKADVQGTEETATGFLQLNLEFV